VRRARALVAAVAALTPRLAWACYNEDALQRDDAVKRIAQIEFHLRYEQYWLAHQAIPIKMGAFMNGRLEYRAWDARYLVDLRWLGAETADAVVWFRDRVREDATPQHLAWLAEALAIDEATIPEARGILRGLDARDVIPDGRAYEVLARVTTGAEHVRALGMCRKRALVKSICGPAPRTT
jgi:hypothetical protein